MRELSEAPRECQKMDFELGAPMGADRQCVAEQGHTRFPQGSYDYRRPSSVEACAAVRTERESTFVVSQ